MNSRPTSRQLGPADQDLALLLLPADRLAHTLGQAFHPARAKQPAAQAAEHQRFSSQRLAGRASSGRGRRATTDEASRSVSRRSAQALENSGR